MAQTITRSLSELFGIGGTKVSVADPTLSSGQTSTLAVADLGANIYTQGIWEFRIKSGNPGAAGAQIQLAVAQDSAFTVNKQILGNEDLPSVTGIIHQARWFSSGGALTFRFARLEALGVALSGGAITLDYQVVAVP